MSDQTQNDNYLWTDEDIAIAAAFGRSALHAFRDDYERVFKRLTAQLAALEAERDALRHRVAELAASVDEEALTIAYAMGYAAAQDKARQQQEADHE